jgi:hypothetical protein
LKVIFYNIVHVGDIVISKPFVREIIKQLPHNEFYYSHFQSKLITEDLCSFETPQGCSNETDEFISQSPDCMVIHTWLGRHGKILTKKLSEDSFKTCHFEQQLDAYQSLLKPYGIDISYMGNAPEKHMWEIEDKYINGTLPIKKGFKVLIYTNESLSLQTDNVNQNKYIEEISKDFPEVIFYVTSSLINKSNIICLNKHFKQKGLDLFQYAELSKKCNIITGGPSGPLIFSWLKSNLLDKNKTYVVQCKNELGGCQFTSKQKNKTLRVKSTKELYETLKDEIKNGLQ